MLETEIRGELAQIEFENLLQKLKSDKNYKYSQNKRITFCYGDYSNQTIDMRVRITDGIPVIMQKVGAWADLQRDEIEVALSKDLEEIFKVYKIFSNIYKTFENSFEIIIQHENSLFEDDEIEIKLSKQFGKSDYFIFEIESIRDNVDLHTKARELGITPQDKFESEEDRKKRNENVNLNPKDLTDEEIKNLMLGYLS